MSWCGDYCEIADEIVDVVVGPAEEACEDLANAVNEGLATLGEYAKYVGTTVEEGFEDIETVIVEAARWTWDYISNTGVALWEWVKAVATDIWEVTASSLEAAWDWLRESAYDIWDFVSNVAESVWCAVVAIAEKVWAVVEDDLVPLLIRELWILTHVQDFVLGFLGGLVCIIMGGKETGYTVIEGLYNLDEDLLKERMVGFFPKTTKYVVFSDHHLFTSGSSIDKFREMGNHELYIAALAAYYEAGFTLVENGDVEDLWFRDVTIQETVQDEITDILWPFASSLEDDYEDARIRSQAIKIFENNADVYQTIRNAFHNSGRFIRIAGNHDQAWRESKYLRGLQVVYPGIEVFDYAFIGEYGSDIHSHSGQTPHFIITHGHELNIWNRPGCAYAGSQMTEAASGETWYSVSYIPRAQWMRELRGVGFDNTPSDDEDDFYDRYRKDFSDKWPPPYFILGHSHDARHQPMAKDFELIPSSLASDYRFLGYSNCGTAGRWESFVWCVAIVQNDVLLQGWTWGDDGKPVMYTFSGDSHLTC
jgi:hypothetical protein